jgi:hypothetical protein
LWETIKERNISSLFIQMSPPSHSRSRRVMRRRDSPLFPGGEERRATHGSIDWGGGFAL